MNNKLAAKCYSHVFIIALFLMLFFLVITPDVFADNQDSPALYLRCYQYIDEGKTDYYTLSNGAAFSFTGDPALEVWQESPWSYDNGYTDYISGLQLFSSNTDVIEIKYDNNLHINGPGTTTITLYADEYSPISFTINIDIQPKDFILTYEKWDEDDIDYDIVTIGDSISLEYGTSIYVTNDAEQYFDYNYENVESSNTSVVKVGFTKDNPFTLKATGVGKSVITVTGKGFNTKYFTVNVTCDHDWDKKCIRQATIKSKGVLRKKCSHCGTVKESKYSWKLKSPDNDYHKSYNIDYATTVYKSSKSVTVKMDNVVKGSVLKVQIGKKTYKKKLGSKKTVKIQIKNPKAGSKVFCSVYYKSKLIGDYYKLSDDLEYYRGSDKVYYAKNIKTGMTKKQVRQTFYWGGPDDTASSSGGWSYWYYDDGSYIGFKNGRVRYWYAS